MFRWFGRGKNAGIGKYDETDIGIPTTQQWQNFRTVEGHK